MKEKFERYINSDYFNIKKDVGSDQNKKFNLYILIMLCTLLFIFLFYLILWTFTNYNQLDDLDDYVKYFKSNNLSKFSNITLGMKIMPSYNTHKKNVFLLRPSQNPEETKLQASTSLSYSYDLTTTFFKLNHTNKVFPKFKFTKDNIPVGNSVIMCISINWGDSNNNQLHYDIMKRVQGFPNCTETLSGKFIWNEEDPVNGVDVPVWIQHMYEADCSDYECDEYCADKFNGVFVNGVNRHVCYSYDVLDGICIVIDYDKVSNNYFFAGGCFPDNKTYITVPAVLNEIYKFKGIEIEIRDKSDPIIKAGEMSNYSFSFGNSWRYFAWLLNIILILAIAAGCYVGFQIYKIKKKSNESNDNNDNNVKSNNNGLIENENKDEFGLL